MTVKFIENRMTDLKIYILKKHPHYVCLENLGTQKIQERKVSPTHTNAY